MAAGIILLAQLNSERLPAKALAPIGGRTMLDRCLTRLMSRGMRVILATTTQPEDDSLAVLAGRLGAWVYRGHPTDPLARFCGAAETFGLSVAVRASGDNPAVDHEAPRRVISALSKSGADFACEGGLPIGAGVEAMTIAALRASDRMASSDHDREHVTSFITSNAATHRLRITPAPAHLIDPALRLTVDTEADLAWVRELHFRTGSADPSLYELISAARRAKKAA
jgi:spore coat polysaccharide biosynthesis protein SpsF